MTSKSEKKNIVRTVIIVVIVLIVILSIPLWPWIFLYVVFKVDEMRIDARLGEDAQVLEKWLDRQDIVNHVSLSHHADVYNGFNNIESNVVLAPNTNPSEACSIIGETIAVVNNEREEHFRRSYDLKLNFRWIYHDAVIEDNLDTASQRIHDLKKELPQHCDSFIYAAAAVDDADAKAVDIRQYGFLVKRWDGDATEDKINDPAAIFENDEFGRTTSDNYSDGDNWLVKVENSDKEKIKPVSKFVNYVTGISPLLRSGILVSPEIYIDTDGLTNPNGMVNQLEDNDTYIYISNYDEIRPHDFGEGELGEHLASFMKETEVRKVAVCNEMYADTIDECEYFELNDGSLERRAAVVENKY